MRNNGSKWRVNSDRIKAWIPGLSLSGVLIIILLIWKVPEQQARDIKDPKDHASIENAARGTFVQALGGLFLIVTTYFSFQNLKVTQQNLVATQEKQVTERFAKAIEQLGNENIHIRLGAIYALERIAKDSDKDYWQVMEILTAYVRERSPYPPREEKANNTPLWGSVLTMHQKNNQPTRTDSQKDVPLITTDIQAVLTVITRRTKSYRQGEENRLDLNGSNLQGGNLQGANLQGGNLQGANLQGANLKGAYLQGAYLQGAYLVGAYLKGANLKGANLEKANLQGAYLLLANLEEAFLLLAKLQGANLKGAYLQGAYLQGAELQDAKLQGAYLVGAELTKVKDLTLEQLKSAENWQAAQYDPEVRECLGLTQEPPKN